MKASWLKQFVPSDIFINTATWKLKNKQKKKKKKKKNKEGKKKKKHSTIKWFECY